MLPKKPLFLVIVSEPLNKYMSGYGCQVPIGHVCDDVEHRRPVIDPNSDQSALANIVVRCPRRAPGQAIKAALVTPGGEIKGGGIKKLFLREGRRINRMRGNPLR